MTWLTILRAFARARDWEQYHTPKNLAMALAGEVGELIACFQWMTPDESAHVMQDPGTAAAVESELADVLQYLIRLADVLDVDLGGGGPQESTDKRQAFPRPMNAARLDTASRNGPKGHAGSAASRHDRGRG